MKKLFQENVGLARNALIKFPRIWIISIALLLSVGVNISSEVVWKCATKEAAWATQANSLVFRDKMVVVEHGGKMYNSPDGIEWTYCCNPSIRKFVLIRNVTHLVYDDKLWILGGDGDC